MHSYPNSFGMTLNSEWKWEGFANKQCNYLHPIMDNFHSGGWDSSLCARAEELSVRIILLLCLNRRSQQQFTCNISKFHPVKKEKVLGNVSKSGCSGDRNSGSGVKNPLWSPIYVTYQVCDLGHPRHLGLNFLICKMRRLYQRISQRPFRANGFMMTTVNAYKLYFRVKCCGVRG